MDTDDSQERKGEKQPPEVFYKKAVLSNFAIFTVKHLCRSLLLIKLLKRDSIKKRLQQKCLPVNIVKFLRTPILKKHLQTTAFVGSSFIIIHVIPLYHFHPLMNIYL